MWGISGILSYSKLFTVNALQRGDNDLLIRHIGLLRNVVRNVRRRHRFAFHCWVVLAEYMQCVSELPSSDTDFATRWR